MALARAVLATAASATAFMIAVVGRRGRPPRCGTARRGSKQGGSAVMAGSSRDGSVMAGSSRRSFADQAKSLYVHASHKGGMDNIDQEQISTALLQRKLLAKRTGGFQLERWSSRLWDNKVLQEAFAKARQARAKAMAKAKGRGGAIRSTKGHGK